MSEWHEERYHARQEALAEASHDCETEKEELEEENKALDDELKELKSRIRILNNTIVRQGKECNEIKEDLRAKLYECNEEKERRGVILGIE
ncbi:MAG: hypothetical protein ACYTBJ_06135 [Planctomycetota bacterium]|jgi:predicted  nucleic acid-binding Zn-ribbon protein